MALNVGGIYVDFEVNANKAIQSLNAFENNIKKAESVIKVFSNNSTNDLKKIESETKKLEVDFKSLNDSINVISSSIKTIGAGIVASQFAKLGIELEQTEKSFEVFLGSIDKAKNLLSELNEFANFTPFNNDEIIQSSKTLLAFGISQEEVIKNLQVLGDISAGTGQKLNDLSYIFGQVATAGRLTSQDLNQLVGRGVPLIQALSKTLNISESEVKKFVEKGAVDFKTFQQALSSLTQEGGLFFNMMKEQSETTGGKISTLSGTFNDLLSKLSYLLIQGLQPFLDILIPITQYLNDLVTGLKNWYDSLSGTDKRLVQITLAITGLFIALSLLAPFITGTLIPAIVSFATTTATSLVSAFTAVNAALGPVGWAIAGILALITILIVKFDDWKDVLIPLKNIINDVFTRIANTGIINRIRELFEKFFSLFKSSETKNLEDTTNKISIFNTTLRGIVATIASLIIATIAFGQLLFKLGEIAYETGKLIARSIGAAYDAIKQRSFDVFKKEMGTIFDNFKDKVSISANDIENIIKNSAKAIKDTWSSVPKEVEENLNEASENIKDKTNEVVNNTNSEVQKVVENIKINFQGAGDFITDTFAEVLNKITSSLESISKSSAPQSFINFADSTLEVFNQIQGVLNGLFQVVGAFMKAISTLKNAIKDSFQNMVSWITYFYDKQIKVLEEASKERKEQLQEELNDYKSHLEDLRREYENHIREMQLLNNQEYLNRKAQLEAQFELQKQKDAEEFERRRKELEKSSIDSEQYYISLQILREDYARLQKEREREFQEELKNLQNEIKEKQIQDEINYNQQKLIEAGVFNEEQWNLLSEEEKRKAYLVYLKEQEAKKEKEINQKKEEEEKRSAEEKKKLEKEKLAVEYFAKLQQFNIDKVMKILTLRIQMITTIAQIFAGLLSAFAPIPFGLGIPIALGLAGALSAMVSGMFGQAIGIVSAMPPPPPPVSLETGGVLGSPRAISGDYIPAMLSNNEAVIDAKRTEKLFNFIDRNESESKKSLNIVFQPNSIYIAGVIDDSLINKISEKITTRIQTSIAL